MKKIAVLVILAGLLSGCATPRYPADPGENAASVTYIRKDVNHYISQETGEVVPAEEKEGYPGKLIGTEYRRTFPTTIYEYESVSCAGSPAVAGYLNIDEPDHARKTLKVRAGVLLVNSFRTKYQTCERDCYKHFYTSVAFVPEQNGQYEVVVEPIDGVRVYKLDNGQRVAQDVKTDLPEACQY